MPTGTTYRYDDVPFDDLDTDDPAQEAEYLRRIGQFDHIDLPDLDWSDPMQESAYWHRINAETAAENRNRALRSRWLACDPQTRKDHPELAVLTLAQLLDLHRDTRRNDVMRQLSLMAWSALVMIDLIGEALGHAYIEARGQL